MQYEVDYTHPKEVYTKVYLRRREVPITDLIDLSANWEKYMYDVDEMSQEELREYLAEDSFYLEGAICVQSFGRNILSFMHWDLVDQLWSYFVQSLEKLLLEGEKSASFHFPDQPLKVEFSYLKRKFTLIIEERKTFVISERGMSEFLQKGREFMSRIEAVKKVPKEGSEVARFDRVLAKLNR